MSLRLLLMASGRGSNVRAILAAIDRGTLDATVAGLVVNQPDAPIAQLEADFPIWVIPHLGMSREAHEAEILSHIAPESIDYVVLAGYMRRLTPHFIDAFAGTPAARVINIHPGLLPAFPGLNGYQAAYEYGCHVAGCTVHLVDEVLDHGPILMQASFDREPGESFASFEAKGLALEHQLYPKALQALALGQVEWQKNHTGRWSAVIKEPACLSL